MTIPQPHTRLYTLSEFEAYIALPENADRAWELIDGEVIEKMPSNPYSSWIVQKILHRLLNYLLENHLPGYVTGEAAGYQVGDQVLSPDGAYTETIVNEGFNPTPPKLAIEVISPTDRSDAIMLKLRKYMSADVPVWVIYPEQKTVDVWIPNAPVRSYGIEDTLTAPDILSGFSMPVREIVEDAPRG